MSLIPAVGSRAQVWHGNAKHTSGGLTKSMLMKNQKTGRIVSKAKHALGVKRMKQMVANGDAAELFGGRKRKRTTKGKKKTTRTKRSRSRSCK